MLFDKKKKKKEESSESEKSIRFFCGLDVLQKLLQDGLDPSVLPETEFSFDLIELPYRFTYFADKKHCVMKIYSRSEIGVMDRSGSAASLDFTRSNGNAAVSTNKELEDKMTAFFAASINLAKYAEANGLLRESSENSGTLLKVETFRITAKEVSGRDRPNLMCTTLFGAPQMGRPYKEEVVEGFMAEAMDLETNEKLAEAGDIGMMDRLTMLYLNGDENTKQDFAKAAYWNRKLADAGVSHGMFNLGLYYAKGCGLERDFNQAVSWMEKARDAGDADAAKLIPLFSEAGENLRKAQAGDAQAMADFAKFLHQNAGSLEQMGPEKDYEEGFEWAKKSAAQFNLDGLWVLALCYEHGRGVEEDCEKAFMLYKRAADKGHVPSMTNIGCLYGRGDGVEKDEKVAMEWIRKAAELNDPDALRLLGREQKEAKDFLEGMDIEALKEAVAAGDKEAVKHYAVACLQGSKYIDDTFEHGEQMLNELAEKGDTESLRILGFTYRGKSSDGEKLYEDMMLKAIEYYERIGDELYTNAEMAQEIAACYSWMPDQKNALDADLAVFWYKVSADLGNEEAKRMYSMIAYTRDNKTAQGIRDDSEFLKYMIKNGKMQEANEYFPDYTPARAEHDRMFKVFCLKYAIDLI